MTKQLMLLTGSGGDAQGWGDMQVTRAMAEALAAEGFPCRIVEADTPGELETALRDGTWAMVWSALYYFSRRADIIGLDPDAVWVADLLEERGIPCLGPGSRSMKNLIQKHDTHRLLRRHGIAVPDHCLVPPGEVPPHVAFPAFVKPNGESRSIGINDNSVVTNTAELHRQVQFIHQTLGQAALVENYLPGQEYTVLMLGNGDFQEILPGMVTVPTEHFGRHRILRSDLRGVGLTKVSIPTDPDLHRQAADLTRAATAALECWEHVRLDLRLDAAGILRIIEVNGIPGLKPGKSWSPQIFSLYHPHPLGPHYEYRALLRTIVTSACARLGVNLIP